MAWALSGRVWHKEIAQPLRELISYLLKVLELPGARWAFDLKGVAVELVVSVEGLYDEEIDGEPYRPAPI